MTVVIIVLAVALLVVAAVAAWLYLQQRRTTHLRSQFGPEYDRTVARVGDRRHAEQSLAERQDRVAQLHIRPLSPEQTAQFAEAWRATQARFVDDPGGATIAADQLIGEVMQARGYPVGDFEAQAADLSVEHPEVVSNYRAAHRIAGVHQEGQASTEQLRQALVHYRALVADLLETQAAPAPPTAASAPRPPADPPADSSTNTNGPRNANTPREVRR